MGALDPRLLALMQCPRDGAPLSLADGRLTCSHGHVYPVVDGVPVMLVEERDQTIGVAAASLAAARSGEGGPLYLETLGLTDAERASVGAQWREDARVDAAIAHLVGATSGYGYRHLIGNLAAYPIPDIPVQRGAGGALLDIGCNWGRWSVSAARKGWRAIGIDPSLGAIMAARRAFGREGLNMAFVCGDARCLPFRDRSFDMVFSYSVIQHFSRADAAETVREIARALKPQGAAKIQMASAGGLRARHVMAQPDYAQAGVFRVRYYTDAQLRALFGAAFADVAIEPEAFGGLGLLSDDFAIVDARAKALIAASTIVRAAARIAAPLRALADSVYVRARKA
ncbi:MAG: methyltransferase domain-containing protein [Hyphomicrobiales bacterium]|nr:methyltransferase domain-containing protein [Hyphomicrobiales bacterium]